MCSSGLPADLAQLILEELIMLGRLSRSSLALFSNQLVYSLRLEDYPGVGNDWLSLLCKSSLLVVNLSRCTQVLPLASPLTPHHSLRWTTPHSLKAASKMQAGIWGGCSFLRCTS